MFRIRLFTGKKSMSSLSRSWNSDSGEERIIGGAGSDNPLTSRKFCSQFLGRASVVNGVLDSVPGDSDSEMDWTFYVPKVRNYIVLYGDAYAEDDILPIENPARNPWHPGIYITHIPGNPQARFSYGRSFDRAERHRRRRQFRPFQLLPIALSRRQHEQRQPDRQHRGTGWPRHSGLAHVLDFAAKYSAVHLQE